VEIPVLHEGDARALVVQRRVGGALSARHLARRFVARRHVEAAATGDKQRLGRRFARELVARDADLSQPGAFALQLLVEREPALVGGGGRRSGEHAPPSARDVVTPEAEDKGALFAEK
jgi:hypothetical protein